MVRTSVIRSVAYHNFNYAEDYDLVLRISEKYPVFILGEFLVKYRLHTTNTSLVSTEMQAAEKNILKDFHKRLGIASDDKRVGIHHSFSSGKMDDFSILDYYYFLLDLKVSAKKSGRYDDKILDNVFYQKWFEIIMLKGGRDSLQLLFKPYIYDYNSITFKHIRKAIKKSIRHIFKLFKD